MPRGIALTEEEQSRRRKEIFNASVHLFLSKGFNETSMREIAKAARIGKSTLYDYFPSKDDILLSFVEDELQRLTEKMEEIARQKIGAMEKLRQMMFAYMDYLATNEDFYMKLSFEVQRLAQESIERIQRKRHALQDLLRDMIEEGIREGSFRPVDSLLATRVMLTALTPAVYTTRPSGSRQEMMEEAFTFVLKGIQGTPPAQVKRSAPGKSNA
ncbi:MAG: TetR/AcrR family transcriptional regulator [Chloroflexi bacterium]|nr:MAG: TetR/AcrR family transcriptional regulator [Chloroflexota bacterium]